MTQTGKPFLVAVVGCTAGGKTALALELARRHGGEIVSCDSMQIYRGMDIGTAKPDEAERAGIPHWLLDVADPTDPRGYSCADYVRDARAAVADILARGKLPILCGGTGLYLDAFLRGGTFEVTDTDQALRASLAAYAAQNGAEALHRELDRASRTEDCLYRALVIGLRYSDRRILWDRIDRRVDAMMAAGLPEETRRLRAAGVFDLCPTAAQAIGYKELFPWLDGHATRAEAVEALKTATRRYAKRQTTWFAARPYVTWVDADAGDRARNFEDIVNNAESLFS